MIIEPEVETNHEQLWVYETDEKKGVCVIADDDMQIKFRFESDGTKFYDVLKIDAEIEKALREPVSVEGMADHLHDLFPMLDVTAMGRAFSHGWITSKVLRAA